VATTPEIMVAVPAVAAGSILMGNPVVAMEISAVIPS
jgi:hypothetical protein